MVFKNNAISPVKKEESNERNMASGSNGGRKKLLGGFNRKKTGRRIIRYIEKPEGPVVTWLKFVAVLIVAGALLWQFADRIKEYIENPVKVALDVNYVTKISFPGLIVCNSQALRYSSVKNSPLDLHVNLRQRSTDQTSAFQKNDGPLPKKSDVKATFSNYLRGVEVSNVKDFYLRASQPADEFIVDCAWSGGEMGGCSFSDFKLVMTDRGPCYRLNIKQSEWPNMTATGPDYSLKLILNVNTLDSYQDSISTKSPNVVIALFLNDDPTPLVSRIGFDLPTGFESSIAIRSVTTKRLEKTKKDGRCNPEANLYLFEKYTFEGCLMQNRFIDVVDICRCLPYNFPDYRNPNWKPNGGRNLTEFLAQFGPCSIEKEIKCVDKSWPTTIDKVNVNCSEACRVHTYKPLVSYAQISENRLRETLIAKGKIEKIEDTYLKAINAKRNASKWSGKPTDDYFRENFAVVNIYFDELSHETIRQHLTYDGWAFASNIAGTLGIIFGFLLGTMPEAITHCVWLCRKYKPEMLEDTDTEDEDEVEEENHRVVEERIEEEEVVENNDEEEKKTSNEKK